MNMNMNMRVKITIRQLSEEEASGEYIWPTLTVVLFIQGHMLQFTNCGGICPEIMLMFSCCTIHAGKS
jgi:hypothetical protein